MSTFLETGLFYSIKPRYPSDFCILFQFVLVDASQLQSYHASFGCSSLFGKISKEKIKADITFTLRYI